MTRTVVVLSLLAISLTAVPAHGEVPNVRCPHFAAFHNAKATQDQLMMDFRRTRQCSLIPRIQAAMRQQTIHMARTLRDCRGIYFPPEVGRGAAIELERLLRAACR